MKKCERCGRNRRFIMCICGYMPMSKKTRILFVLFSIVSYFLAICYMSYQQQESLKNCAQTHSCSSHVETKPSQKK